MDREKVIKELMNQKRFVRAGSEEDKTLDSAIALLKELEPVEPEMEGGGSTWWMVCGECHGQIDGNDDYCRHCGRRILRNEKRE